MDINRTQVTTTNQSVSRKTFDNSQKVQSPTQASAKEANRKEIPLKYKIMLGPVAKYKRYNRFPWKLILTFMLIFATSAQVLLIVEQTGKYSRSIESVWYKLFLEADANYNEDITRTKNYFKVSDARDMVIQSVNNYYNIFIQTNELLEYYETVQDDSGKTLTPVMFVNYYGDASSQHGNDYDLSVGDYGPFSKYSVDDGSLKEYLRSVEEWQIQYKVKQLVPERAIAEGNCYLWTILQVYKFSTRSAIRLEIKFEKQPCGVFISNLNKYIWINVFTMAIAFISLMVQVKYVLAVKERYEKLRGYYKEKIRSPKIKSRQGAHSLTKSYTRINSKNQFYLKGVQKQQEEVKVQHALIRKFSLNSEQEDLALQMEEIQLEYDQTEKTETNETKQPAPVKVEPIPLNLKVDDEKTQRQIENKEYLGVYMRQHQDLPWGQLDFWDKAKLFNKFAFVALIGNIFQIIGTMTYFLKFVSEVEVAEVIIGFGCLFAWATLPRYFMYSQRYSLVLRTMEYALPVLLRAILGIIPFFIGYAILGQCLFWQVEKRFGSFAYSFFSLFAMMNGDNLVPIFEELSFTNFFFGNAYLFFYVFLSIIVIMNIFIIIIEQGFMSVKYKRAYDWLEADDTDAKYNLDPDNLPPDEINIGHGRQVAYEKEIFIKLRDAFEGITDGNLYGKGAPIDNHPAMMNTNSIISQGSTTRAPAQGRKMPSSFGMSGQLYNKKEYKKQLSKITIKDLITEEEDHHEHEEDQEDQPKSFGSPKAIKPPFRSKSQASPKLFARKLKGIKKDQ